MGGFNSEKLSVRSIDIKKFSIEENSTETDQVTFKLEKVDLGFNIEKNIAKIIFEIQLGGQCECSFKIGLILNVDNIEEMVGKGDNGEFIPLNKDFYPHIFAISYSTIRGIVYTKTLGTKNAGIILPVVHPKRFYKRFLETSEEGETKKEDAGEQAE